MHRNFSTLSLPILAAALAVGPSASAKAFPAGAYANSKAGVAIAFDGAGHFHASANGGVKVAGDYTVIGHRVTFTHESGPGACAADQTGVYRWAARGPALTFVKVADVCKGRMSGLRLRFTKQP